MPTWKITTFDSTLMISDGTAPGLADAWAEAFDAVMDHLTAGEFDRCAIVVNDSPPALLIAGRTDDGRIDLLATRAGVADMVVAASGWPLPCSRTPS
jgi:hypothetical protein